MARRIAETATEIYDYIRTHFPELHDKELFKESRTEMRKAGARASEQELKEILTDFLHLMTDPVANWPTDRQNEKLNEHNANDLWFMSSIMTDLVGAAIICEPSYEKMCVITDFFLNDALGIVAYRDEDWGAPFFEHLVRLLASDRLTPLPWNIDFWKLAPQDTWNYSDQSEKCAITIPVGSYWAVMPDLCGVEWAHRPARSYRDASPVNVAAYCVALAEHMKPGRYEHELELFKDYFAALHRVSSVFDDTLSLHKKVLSDGKLAFYCPDDGCGVPLSDAMAMMDAICRDEKCPPVLIYGCLEKCAEAAPQKKDSRKYLDRLAKFMSHQYGKGNSATRYLERYTKQRDDKRDLIFTTVICTAVAVTFFVWLLNRYLADYQFQHKTNIILLIIAFFAFCCLGGSHKEDKAAEYRRKVQYEHSTNPANVPKWDSTPTTPAWTPYTWWHFWHRD